MSCSPISQPVVDFIRCHIHSVEQLEVLLYLFDNQGRSYSAAEIGAHLRTAINSIEKRLQDLVRRGLAQVEREGAYSCRYLDVGPEQSALIRQLGEAYEGYRIRVIDLIFSRPVGALDAFVDAFKWGKGED